MVAAEEGPPEAGGILKPSYTERAWARGAVWERVRLAV